jgi:hypothetical protein
MVAVFKFDGTLKCGLGSEIPLKDMQEELVALGATVIASEKSWWPGFIIEVCGAPTGHCNVFQLDDDTWPKLAKSILGAGFRVWPAEDGAKQGNSAASISASSDDLLPWPFGRSTGAQGTYGTNGISLSANAQPRIDTSKSITELIGKRLRVYQDGDVITKDFRLDRANIVLARDTGLIIDIWFG